jgi:hypothetical protein
MAVMAGGVSALVSAPVLLLTIGLIVWLLRTTDYTLSDSDLRIRSGPFGWRVSLADITSLTPTRNPLSSPALSLDRLRIQYGHRSIMISPEDREGFLRELDRRRSTSVA